jgi:hypothetical protein
LSDYVKLRRKNKQTNSIHTERIHTEQRGVEENEKGFGGIRGKPSIGREGSGIKQTTHKRQRKRKNKIETKSPKWIFIDRKKRRKKLLTYIIRF